MLFRTPPHRTATRRARIARWPSAALVLVLASALAAVPSDAVAASTTKVPACSSVNLRTGPSTSRLAKTRITTGTTVTVVAKVSGARWSTRCPSAKSGSNWYRISAINGRTVKSLYGVTYLYAATGVLKVAPASAPAPSATPAPSPTPTPTPSATPTPSPAASTSPASTTKVPACSSVNLRTGPSTSRLAKTRITTGTTVTVVAKVSGARWSTRCPSAKSGSNWYRISAINGRTVKSLYGVTYLYAATGVLKAAPASAPAPSTTPKLTGSTTFYGRGYGHGVGLSQYGARGRALAGQTADEILAHYYPGASSGSIAPDAQIRVRLLNDFAGTASSPLTVIGRGGRWGLRGETADYPADARVRLIPRADTSGWRLVVTDAAGSTLRDSAAPTDLRLEPRDPGTTLQLSSKPSRYDLYRGTLRVILATSTADVVNELPLESYLRGVVPAEMPSSWPTEALTAQSIAARSYAAYRLRPGVSTFDAYDDTRSQVYLGVHRETAATDAVIVATANRILRSGKAIANTLFHSTGGGATENNENVFVSSTGAKLAGPVSYLRGSSDRDPSGAAYDAAAPYATWKTKAYSLAALSTIFAADSRTNVGTLTALDLHHRGVSQRLISVTLAGSLGTRTVSGAVFVAAFNAGRPAGDPPLRSTLLDVAPIP